MFFSVHFHLAHHHFFHGKSSLKAQIPSISKKFPKFQIHKSCQIHWVFIIVHHFSWSKKGLEETIQPIQHRETLLAGTRPRASTTKVLPPRAVQARPRSEANSHSKSMGLGGGRYHICMHACMYVCVHVYVYMYMYMYVYIYISKKNVVYYVNGLYYPLTSFG